MKFKSIYFKIVLILVFTFFLSGFFSRNLFLSNTPRIRKNFLAYITSELKNKTNTFLSYFVKPNNFQKSNQGQIFTQNNKINKNQIYDNLINNLKPVGKGVEAATYKNYSYTKVDLDKVEWIEIEIKQLDGTVTKVQVPKRY